MTSMMWRSITFFGSALLLGVGAEEAAAEEKPVASVATPTTVDGSIFFEPFGTAWEQTWKVSKDADFTGTWKREQYAAGGDDYGLVVSDPAKKHAVSTLFAAPIDPKDKGLVIQYELQLKNGLQCGGAYIKLLTATDALEADGFKAETPYTIMFGPDRCGETNKVHFILRHKNPVSGEWEEKHLASPPQPDVTAKTTHLYTAIIGTDNTVKILVDNVEKVSASLLSETDFKPPVTPPKMIDDPEDKKPENWIDEPKMDEPGATKPDDWDEDAPTQIPDPKSSKPSSWLDDAPDMVPDPASSVPDDWDADEDGEWEAPMIKNPDCEKFGCGEWKAPLVANPDYKGKWFAPRVDNPEYIGVWAPKKIDNPNFFVDESPHAVAPIGGIGIELWTMQNGILFDNLLLTNDAAVASKLAAETFLVRQAQETEVNKAAQREAELAAGGDGFMGKLKAYGRKAMYYVQDQPMMVAGSLCLGLIPLLLLCCWPRGKAAEEDEEDEEPAAADDDDDAPIKDVTEEKEKEKKAGKEAVKPKESGAKKRTKKAD